MEKAELDAEALAQSDLNASAWLALSTFYRSSKGSC